MPLTNAIGALTITNRFYNRLPEDLKKLLITTGKIASDKIRNQARIENEKSMQILKDSGIKFLWSKEDIEFNKLIEIRNKAAKYLEDTNYIPKQLFSRVEKLLSEIRKPETSSITPVKH